MSDFPKEGYSRAMFRELRQREFAWELVWGHQSETIEVQCCKAPNSGKQKS